MWVFGTYAVSSNLAGTTEVDKIMTKIEISIQKPDKIYFGIGFTERHFNVKKYGSAQIEKLDDEHIIIIVGDAANETHSIDKTEGRYARAPIGNVLDEFDIPIIPQSASLSYSLDEINNGYVITVDVAPIIRASQDVHKKRQKQSSSDSGYNVIYDHRGNIQKCGRIGGFPDDVGRELDDKRYRWEIVLDDSVPEYGGETLVFYQKPGASSNQYRPQCSDFIDVYEKNGMEPAPGDLKIIELPETNSVI